MPRPAYIICSEYGALDRYNNRVSAFHIAEHIEIRLLPDPDPGQPARTAKPFPMRVVAAWIREPHESSEEMYEAEIVIRLHQPDGKVLDNLAVSRFDKFAIEKAIHRLALPELKFPGFPGPGIMEFECRIRHLGEEDWLSRQSCNVLITEAEEPAPSDTSQQKNPDQ